MDERIISQYCLNAISKRIFVSRKIVLVLMLPLTVFPAIADEITEQPVIYTGNYQSYFQDEPDINVTSISSTIKCNEQTLRNVSSPSTLTGKTAAPTASLVPVTLSAATDNKTTGVKTNNKGENPEDVSLLRLRQEDPPVHWNSIGRNMEVGGLHGNIGSQIEIDDVRWSDNKKNSGKFKLATIQAFLRHDELPNWYFGFWNAREDSYKGQFSNQDYKGTNTINEFFVGHIF